MAEDWPAEIANAAERGKESLRSEPRARKARYDPRSGRIVVELTNDCSFAFPARSAQGLERASDNMLSKVEILGAGLGLHWEALDVDLSVPGLLAGMFGTKNSWTASARLAPGQRPPVRKRRLRAGTEQKAAGRGSRQNCARHDCSALSSLALG